MKKSLLVFPLALLALLAVLLVGCGGGETTTTAAPADTNTTAAPADNTTTAPQGEPIVLGVPTALGTIEGADVLRAIELAAEEINAAGGVDVGGTMRPFTVESIDTREAEPGVPTNDALASIEKLITEKKPDAIVGGAFRSEVLLASMDLVSKYKIPYITSIAMSPAYEDKIVENPEQYKYFFRTGQNAIFFVGGLAQIAGALKEQFGFTKMYIMHQDVLWATGSAGGLAKAAAAGGWEVLGTDAYPTGSSDFSSSLNKAKAAGAQVIVPIFDMPQSGTLLKQARSMKLPALVAGFISPLVVSTGWDATDGEVQDMIGMLNEPASLALEAMPSTVKFYDAYVAKYGEELAGKLSGHGPGPAYDSVYLLAAAIEKAGTVEADALVPVLATTEIDGVVGHLKFNEKHQVIYGSDPTKEGIIIGFQWQDGKRVAIYPPAVASGTIVLPEGLQ